MAARYIAEVHVSFVCRGRNGSVARVPVGACIIEKGSEFTAICWEAADGRRHQRAEVPNDLAEEILKWGKLERVRGLPP